MKTRVQTPKGNGGCTLVLREGISSTIRVAEGGEEGINATGMKSDLRGLSSVSLRLTQTAEKRHVFKRGYGVLAYSKEIKQEKIALTIRFIFWTAAVRKDCSYMLRIPSMRA